MTKSCTVFLLSALAISTHASAELFSSPKATLEVRNYYLDRDYRGQIPANQPREWAQGFVFSADSGLSHGDQGVGVDVLGVLGIKLDSGRMRTRTGLLANDNHGEAKDQYSRVHAAVRGKFSQTEVKFGGQRPNNPVLMSNYTRLLPAVFSGATVTSQEISGLTLEAGRLNRSAMRDSGDIQDMAYYKNLDHRYHADNAMYLGGHYQATPALKLSYFHMDLEDMYRQHYAGFVYNKPVTEGVNFTADVRYFNSKSQGTNVLGKVDNDNYNGLFSVKLNSGHLFGLGYQIINGEGDFPFLAGSDPYVVNLSLFDTFTREKTRSYQARYGYDFAVLGVPGLTFMGTYVKAGNVHTPTLDDGKYFERDLIFSYVVQSGPLRSMSMSLRQAFLRAGHGMTEDINETRVIISYPINLL